MASMRVSKLKRFISDSSLHRDSTHDVICAYRCVRAREFVSVCVCVCLCVHAVYFVTLTARKPYGAGSEVSSFSPFPSLYFSL
jgi:hypothetical protein